MRQAYFIAGLLIGGAIAIFALQNTGAVQLRLLFWQTEGSLAAVVLLSAIGGLVIALLFGIPEIVRARWRIRALERRLAGRPPGTTGPAAEGPPADHAPGAARPPGRS